MRSVAVVIFAVLCWGAASCGQPQSRLVELLQGPVRGYRETKYGIYAFYDIPYAKAPTGADRFKGPLPPPVWSEVFEAVDRLIMCPQTDQNYIMRQAKGTMPEDCLTASVYVPETKEKNLPVVVYVHGGGFLQGWGNLSTPKNLVKSKKVIAVTFNYRLGAHGFLCLGTENVPGNAGMKDQVALLRWVKSNIAKFGGNPDEVTIAGYSAGSASVDLLMISKLTDNLFKRVIPESGANVGVISIQADPIKNAKEYASLITSDHFEDLNALEKFYQTISYEQLNLVNTINSKDTNLYMKPCVERYLGEEMFLEDSPVNILKSGNFKKVPMLYGFANMEGLFRMPLFDDWKNSMNEKFSDFLPADLKFESETEKEEVAEKVKRFYFGEKLTKNEESVLAYIDYFTDVIIAYGMLRSVKLQLEAGNNQIYLYEYAFYDDDTPPVPYTNNVRGADHCAQSFTVLDGLFYQTQTNISDELRTHTKVMREIWLNFMTTGVPIPEDSKLPKWQPVGADWSPYMSLGRTLQLKNNSLLKERTLFWDDIYEKYYFNPIPLTSPFEHTELYKP
ncbi:para-nitrobenzyl esterase-like [Maniola hyperantus]|uniref:para-nitrobenzyl esterase-like n=1 Tax=Aphantopus hyperantus TaxID=2795564 RepID=UPI001567D646|nr:para-nitrobenzyl esterase-like [Maniola hyperantus]